MKKILFLCLISITFISCVDKTSTVQVKNMLPKAVLENVYWGDQHIASQLGPGQSSHAIQISGYQTELPTSKPVKFYLNLNGDKVYLETKKSYQVGIDEEVLILIMDTTQVINPLLEEQP